MLYWRGYKVLSKIAIAPSRRTERKDFADFITTAFYFGDDGLRGKS